MHRKLEELSKVQTLVDEVKSLQNQITDIRNLVFGKPNHGTKLPKVPQLKPDNGEPISPFVGMNYGMDHGALMDELKSVLKSRN